MLPELCKGYFQSSGTTCPQGSCIEQSTVLEATLTDYRQERIRQKAYQIWESAGRPNGQHDEHWRQAKAAIDAGDEIKGGAERLSEAGVLVARRRIKRKGLPVEKDSSNSKALTDKGNLSRVAKGEQLEVQHLAETTDLSPNQAKALLRKHGNDWAKIKDEAENFKAEG